MWYCFHGVFLGCLVGVLPGLGALIAISLLLPITYHLPATGAMIMLAGVYYGAVQGIQPGPQVLTNHPDLFWGLIVSFWIGNIFLAILNIPVIGMWVRMLAIPYPRLFPAIVLFTCIGV
ncbi:MAG: tripartite tricarboxylate transporter permease [Polaromonas sp.]